MEKEIDNKKVKILELILSCAVVCQEAEEGGASGYPRCSRTGRNRPKCEACKNEEGGLGNMHMNPKSQKGYTA